MNKNNLLLLTLIAVTSTVFMTNLGGAYLLDQDEPLNAECAREMYVQGNWTVPMFNQELRTAKPILLYWLVICSYHLFGVTEFASRLPSGLLSMGTVFCVFGIGARLFCFRTGIAAALIMATSVLFAAVGRACTPDPVLVFFTCLTMLCFLYAVTTRTTDSSGQQSLTWHFVRNRQHDQHPVTNAIWFFLAMYSATAIAMLAKGPIGLLLPACIIGLFGMINLEFTSAAAKPNASHSKFRTVLQGVLRCFSPKRFLTALIMMKPWLALLPVVVFTLPWYASVALQTEGEWLNKFIGHDNIGRFLKPLEGHSGPIVYYIPVLLIGLFPWSIFLFPSLANLYEKVREHSRRNNHNQPEPHLLSLCFLGCWAGCYLVFFSLAATKLPNYVLPAYPALALLIGFYLDERLLAPAIEKSTLIPWSLVSLIVVGSVMALGLPVVTHFLLPGSEWLGILGLLLLIGGAIARSAFRKQHWQTCFQTLCVTAGLFTFCIVAVSATVVSRYQESPRIAKFAGKDTANRQWASYDYFSPNLVFYTQQKIHRLDTPTEVADFLKQPSPQYIVMPEKTFTALRNKLPKQTTKLFQTRRFLHHQHVVLIGNAPTVARRETVLQ